MTCKIVVTASLAAALLWGSAHAQNGLGLWSGGTELPGFPVYRQPDSISCGPTCCSMVLKYYGVSAGIGPLKTRAGTRWLQSGGFRVGMTLPSGMEAALESYRCAAAVRKGSLNDIVSYLNQNRPPILLVRSGNDTWHYIVATGYMHGTSYFKIADPSGNEYWMRGRDLESIWRFSHKMGTYSRDQTIRRNILTASYVEDRRCRTCNGDGSLGWTNCLTCSGTGKLSAGILGSTKCPTCSGRGKWSSKCHFCGGDGRETDYYRKAVESAGVTGHTLIVPDRGKGKGNVQTSTSITRIEYTIRNDSNRTVRFRLPSGRSYSLAPGETGSYRNSGRRGSFRLFVYDTGREYRLTSGRHKFWWMNSERRIAFDANYN